jgi:seryl-tRNA synthetase
MATSQKIAAQIAAAEKEIMEKENHVKELRQKFKNEESKEISQRRKERGAILESFIEDAATFTNEQIKAFLSKTITSKFALNTLAELKGQTEVEANAKSAESAENMG